MAMHVPKAPGFSSMLKEGARHFRGLEEAVYRNIEACVELAKSTQSAYGPTGQNKMVINHIEKLFVTNDAATILNELEVAHPAAKMLVLASQQQQQEAGDGTNFVIMLAGSLLSNADELLRMGLSVTEVIEGYEKALRKALEILPTLSTKTMKEFNDESQVISAIKPAIMSKQYGNEDFLSELIGKACVACVTERGSFNVDNVRVCKVLGSGIGASSIVQGMVFRRDAEGDVRFSSDCPIVVYSCPLDNLQTETKGTILINTADELKDFSKGEENQMEAVIRSIAETGVKVVVTGGKVGELAIHYVNKYKLLVVRLTSKFDVRRIAKSVNATPLPRLVTPSKEEIGHVDSVRVDEIGDTNVVIFRQERSDSAVSTIVVRGSTENLMDDVERAIDDGVNTYKCLTRDGRMVAGAGATEIEIARQLAVFAEQCPGLEQYAIAKFAQSFETVVKALAENSGQKATEVISQLYAAHQAGNTTTGLVFEGDDPTVKDAVEANIYEPYLVKHWGIKFATQAANTVLKVDQIIMARPAGGPKPKENKNWDED